VFKKLIIPTFLFFLFIGTSLAIGTNFDDFSSESNSAEQHGQYLGNTGTSDRAFTEITFLVTGTDRLVKSTGATGLSMSCYYSSAWNSCTAITPISVTITRVSDETVISCGDPCTGLSTSEIYRVRYYRGSSVNLQANADVYFRYNIGDTYNFKILGSSTGSGAKYSDYGTNLNAWASTWTSSSGINSVYTCWNSTSNCGTSPLPTGSFTDEVADGIAGTLTVSGEFDFVNTGSGYSATATVFKQCETTTGEFEIQGHSVAQIKWFADDDVDDTISKGSGNYVGAGYTTTNANGTFSNVVLPYTVGRNCTYPTHIIVRDNNNDIVWSTIEDNNNVPIELIPDGATSLITTPEIEETQEGIFSGIIRWFTDFFNNTFGVSTVLINFNDHLSTLKLYAETKAPYGYFITVFGSNLDTPTITEDIPDFVYALEGNGYGGLQDITVNFPTEMDNLTHSMRNYLSVAIWLLFFGYILMVVRRVHR
jgi:hypothetical protein